MPCFPGDTQCYLNDFINTWIIPFVFVIVLLVIAVFILPKAGWKGVFISILLIFMILFWYGLVPGLPALRTYFGMAVMPIMSLVISPRAEPRDRGAASARWPWSGGRRDG